VCGLYKRLEGARELIAALSYLKVASFIVMYRVGDEGLYLPKFKGSTFRGVFGSVLKEAACTCPHGQKSDVTSHHDHCVYAYLFETTSANDQTQHSDNVPRPFTFAPPDNDKNFYAPGETIQLGFSLFGKGIEYLPYFIYAMRNMGEKGFGRGNHSVELVQVFSENLDGSLESIYKNSDRLIHNNYRVHTGEEIIQANSLAKSTLRKVFLYFISPTRLKHSGRYIEKPEFHIVLRSAVRRITSLLHVHHDEPKINMDFGALFRQAEEIKLIKSDAQWRDWERYSNRQSQRLKIGGITGSAVYEGELTPYLPWLMLAEHANIGKNATFGLGDVKVRFKQ
jgi:hypothetical protein